MKKYLKKRGRLAKDKAGNLVLVAPHGKAFATTHDMAKVWMLFDGQKPFRNIVSEMTENAEHSYEEIYQEVEKIVSKLKSAQLMEELPPTQMQA